MAAVSQAPIGGRWNRASLNANVIESSEVGQTASESHSSQLLEEIIAFHSETVTREDSPGQR